ncbi:hypothetical protein QBC47DRAFT_396264 [Echria macrotheca]|uniref:DUF6604 domain-containing protein n=1 Tax=Echria macrotheca TaxID=438768 RepID=A0AAJ0BL45_9PEZI|nr:hypothetical protein QBC47DRAFT_396264 [Echria macrotheca]
MDAPKGSKNIEKRKKSKTKTAQSLPITVAPDAKAVHWSQLEGLAQRVVDHAASDEIPLAAINILRDVVNLRKQSYCFFSGALKHSEDENTKQSNTNHIHIISACSSGPWPSSKAWYRRPPKSPSNTSTHPDAKAPGVGDDELEDEAAEETTGPLSKTSKRGEKKKASKKPNKQKKPLRLGGPVRFDDSAWEDEYDDEFNLYMMVYCFFVDFETRNYVQ